MLRSDVCYPYPLLRTTPVDYKQSCFCDELTIEVTDTGYRLVTSFSVNNDYISKLVQDKKLEYSVVVTCKSTLLRKMFRVDSENPVIELQAGFVHYLVSVTPYIIASEDIDPFSDPDFADEFTGMEFSIEKGAIIGIGNERRFNAIFENDIIKDAAALISVKFSDTEKHMTIDTDGINLKVILPSKFHDTYMVFQDNTTKYSLLHSIITIPVLMEAINIIHNTDPEDKLAQKAWFITLQQKIHECAAREHVDEESMFDSPARTAQIIMENVFGDAMIRLAELSDN